MSFRIRSVKSRNSTRNGPNDSHLAGDQPLSRNNKFFPKNNQCSADMPMIGGEVPPRNPKAKIINPEEQWASPLDRRAPTVDRRKSAIDQRATPLERRTSKLDIRASPVDKGAFQSDMRASPLDNMRASPQDTGLSPLGQGSYPRNQPSVNDLQSDVAKMKLADQQMGDAAAEGHRPELKLVGHCNSTEFDTAFNEKHTDDVPRPCRHRTRGLGRAFMTKDNECSWMRNMQEDQGRVEAPVPAVPRGAATRRATQSGAHGTQAPQDPPAPMPSEANSDWYMAQMANIQRQQQLLYQQQQTLLHKIASVCPTPASSFASNLDPGCGQKSENCPRAPVVNGQPPAAMLQMVNHVPGQATFTPPCDDGQTLAEKSKAAKEVYESLLQQQHEELKQQQQHQQEQEQHDLQCDAQQQDIYEEDVQQLVTKNAGALESPSSKSFKRRLKGHAARNYAARDEGTADLVMFHRGPHDLPPEEMDISAKEQDARNEAASRATSAQPSNISQTRTCGSHDNTVTPSNGLRESMSLYGQDPNEKRAVGAAIGTRTPHWQGSRCSTAPPQRSPGESVPPTPPNTSANNTAALLSHVRKRLEEGDGTVSPGKALGGRGRRSASQCRSAICAQADDPVEGKREKEWWEVKTPPKEFEAKD